MDQTRKGFKIKKKKNFNNEPDDELYDYIM